MTVRRDDVDCSTCIYHEIPAGTGQCSTCDGKHKNWAGEYQPSEMEVLKGRVDKLERTVYEKKHKNGI